ncbi:MAG: Gfo/Idh/MocA family oxidoreductase [Epulopiscium sp.]|nr:Gfo/Idh/MocA family oxidoreductase [Candidatus Epulonipiscium sp.]
MKTIGWGIIGCGNVTEVKSGPGFQKADHSKLVAVMRRNGELAKDYAARHDVPKWYDDAEDLINDPDVEAVYIATPPAFHKEYVLQCARAKKPVYVEKPMALNHTECQEMIQACEDAGIPLYVAYYRRALPRFIKIKELIDSGVIGEVRFVTVRNFQRPLSQTKEEKLPWRVIPEISGGGIFHDIGCHTLDILDYILGPIKEAKGMAGNQAGLYEADDIVSATFVFESGIQGIGIWCFSAFENYDQNEIIGSKGKIVFSTFGSEPIALITEEETVEFPIENPIHIQQPLIQTIVNEINGKAECPSTGETGARTSWVMDQIV